MIGMVNTGGGTGGTLMVTAPAGVTVTVSKDGKTKTKVAGADGLAVFKGLKSGQWTLTITDGEQTASKTVEIVTDYATEISYNVIPEFTYTGDFEIVNDSDEPITTSQDNWKIRFLTSGTLTFTKLNGAENGIDVFCVGGGGAGGNWCSGGSDGSGGCGGYTKTSKNVSVTTGNGYSIVIGAGGVCPTVENSIGKSGGKTSAFGKSANGGSGGHAWADSTPGSGGSGGGSGNEDKTQGGNGGSDGGNGGSGNWSGGNGQGTTTREFGETSGKLYAGGGGGSWYGVGGAGGGAAYGNSAKANTGGGGGGGYNATGVKTTVGGSGGSGIVIIRNAREVA